MKINETSLFFNNKFSLLIYMFLSFITIFNSVEITHSTVNVSISSNLNKNNKFLLSSQANKSMIKASTSTLTKTKTMSLTDLKKFVSENKNSFKKQIDMMIEFHNLESQTNNNIRYNIDYSNQSSLFSLFNTEENKDVKSNYKDSNVRNNSIKNKLDFNFKSSTSNKNSSNTRNNVNSSSSSNKSSSLKTKFTSALEAKLGIQNSLKNKDEIKDSDNFREYDEDEVIEDWFMIASLEFDNTSRFPPIKIATGDTITIAHDERYFRLNQAYNCTDTAKPKTERMFFFRINKERIYYTATSTDINVLGVINVKSTVEITKIIDDNYEKEIYCFLLVDNDSVEWKICNCDKEKILKVYCFLKFLVKDFSDTVCHTNAGCIIEKKVIQPIIIIPIPSPKCNENWDYSEHGRNWECTCSEGHEQSPIDLPNIIEAIESPLKPLFSYKEVSKLADDDVLDKNILKGTPNAIKYNEGKVSILNYDFGKLVTLDGTVYRADEITFHTPSQHTIKGERFDMEMVIHHSGVSKGDIGKQASLSFLFKQAPGVYNLFMESIDVFDLPNPLEMSKKLLDNIHIPKVLYSTTEKEDFDSQLLTCFSFYTYQGSVMYPPCTERTIVYVASNPIPLSTTTIQLFKEALKAPDMINKKTFDVYQDGSEFQGNYRENNERNGRPVFHYKCEDCYTKKKKIPEPKGHYEKVSRKSTQYFFVNGEKPSGLPGSYVVSEKEAKGLDLVD